MAKHALFRISPLGTKPLGKCCYCRAEMPMCADQEGPDTTQDGCSVPSDMRAPRNPVNTAMTEVMEALNLWLWGESGGWGGISKEQLRHKVERFVILARGGR